MSADLAERIPPLRHGRGPLRRRLAWRSRGGLHTPVRTLRRGRSARRRWPRRVLLGTVALVALLIIAAVGAVIYARWRFDQIHRTQVSGLAVLQPNKPFDILVVGSDTSAVGNSASSTKKTGSPHAPGANAIEAIVVARIDPSTRGVRLLSIPGGTYVNIPGSVANASGPRPIIATFNSGPSLLVETITRSFHIPITYYMTVNFAGLNRVVNALGGIHLDFPYPARDSYTGLDVTTGGCDLIDGSQSLGLVASRHLYYFARFNWRADPGTEASLIQRQDAFYRAVASATKSIVTNPVALNNLVAATTSDVTIDQTLSETKAIYLAQLFRGFTGTELETKTLPVIPYTTRSGASVLAPAPRPDERMIARFLSFGESQQAASSARAGLGEKSLSKHSAAGASTVTTVPGSPKATRGNVVYNSTTEPWNPTPC